MGKAVRIYIYIYMRACKRNRVSREWQREREIEGWLVGLECRSVDYGTVALGDLPAGSVGLVNRPYMDSVTRSARPTGFVPSPAPIHTHVYTLSRGATKTRCLSWAASRAIAFLVSLANRNDTDQFSRSQIYNFRMSMRPNRIRNLALLCISFPLKLDPW